MDSYINVLLFTRYCDLVVERAERTEERDTKDTLSKRDKDEWKAMVTSKFQTSLDRNILYVRTSGRHAGEYGFQLNHDKQ